MESDTQFNEMINGLVRLTFRDALKATVTEPQIAGFFPGTLTAQKKAQALLSQSRGES